MGNPYPIEIGDADGVARLQGEATFTDPANQPGGGGSYSKRTLAFTFATVGLAAGVVIYTPAPGERLLDAWVEIAVVFNGTTPLADIGTGDPNGLYGNVNAPVDLTATEGTLTTGLKTVSGQQGGVAALYASTQQNILFPGISDGTPFVLVASQDGQVGGTPLNSTAGAAMAVLLILAAA